MPNPAQFPEKYIFDIAQLQIGNMVRYKGKISEVARIGKTILSDEWCAEFVDNTLAFMNELVPITVDIDFLKYVGFKHVADYNWLRIAGNHELSFNAKEGVFSLDDVILGKMYAHTVQNLITLLSSMVRKEENHG